MLPRGEWVKVLEHEYHIHHVKQLPQGSDLTLVITGGLSNATTVWERHSRIAITVRSADLDQALPGWRDRIVRLHPPRQAGHYPIAELCPGTPKDFCHLIEAAERAVIGDAGFQTEEDLSLEDIREIARLSHQYGALHLISKSVPRWVEQSVSDVWKPENMSEEESDHLELLWVSYEFGLESLFKQVCFNLAYFCDDIIGDPSIMPPGTFDRIYKCRTAFLASRLSRIRKYVNDLRKAVERDTYIAFAICKDDSDNKECAAVQLGILTNWLEDEGIDIDKGKVSLLDSEFKSPVDYFTAPPFITSKLRHIHEEDRRGCGLGTLVDEIRDGGKNQLMLWLAESGDEACPVGPEHLEYIRNQREKIPWDA